VHDVKPEFVHQIAYAHGHDDWLICCYAQQSAPVEMIKVSVRNEHQVNGRQMMNFEAGPFQSFDHLEPLRPVRVDQDIDFVSLKEKRGVTNPSDADFTFVKFWKLRRDLATGAFDEQRRNQDAGKEIAFMPVRSRTQSDTRRIPHLRDRRTIPRRLTNNVSAAFL
jgi:hypothetical protein